MATITKRPSGKWQAIVRKDGKSRSRTFTKRADATAWAREAEVSAERSELHRRVRQPETKQNMTVRQMLERYRDEVTNHKRCAANERYAINGFLRSNLASVRLDKLTTTRAIGYRDRRLEQMKPATVVRELGWLQHAIDIAMSDCRQHLPDGNPVKQVRRPKIDNRRERRLQSGEWDRLFGAVHEERTPLMKPLLKLALVTGMRRGELLGMQWQHVDLERRTVFLPKTKNRQARTVPLSPDAVSTINALPRDNAR